jgi:4-aminobutyrate aminotransferase-like enzyme
MSRFPIIGDVRGKGLMIGVELVEDRVKKTPTKNKIEKIRNSAREKGLIIGSGGNEGCVLRIQPPLVISRAQIDEALNVLEACIKEA